MRRKAFLILVGLGLVLAPRLSFAQSSITGVVRDTSGAVLPGVTVEATSDALIEKVRSAVTDGNGLYRIVDLRPGTYDVTFTLTTPACPIGPQVTEQIKEFVGELDDVTEVEAHMVFAPPWSPEKMSEDAKFALGF